jgi:hypothetical protein
MVLVSCELPERVDAVLTERKLVVVMFLEFERIGFDRHLLPLLMLMIDGCNGFGRRLLVRVLSAMVLDEDAVVE